MPEDDENVSSLGSWMRRRRKTLDLTQAALAHCVGCAEVTIRRLEADVARPSRATAERLATSLEIPPNERTLFLQVARGERSADRLSPDRTHHARTPLVTAQVSGEPMPLDVVPQPAPLLSGSRMPLRRNPLFVGRDANLRQLAQVLHAGTTAAIGQTEIAAATGLGGIGKTQLACEFVHRYGQFFAGGVFWLSFADPMTIPAQVAACGGDPGMRLQTAFDQLPLDKQVQLVQEAWETDLPCLLVFDNCEDEALLDQWRPKHGACRVLVTSRRHHWDPALGVYTLPLDVLRRPDSLALLRSFRPDLPTGDPDLAAIAATLGDLPLALHLAGSFLAKYHHALTPAQYRERLCAPTILDDRSLQAAGVSPTQHVQHVARTFEQSYAQLDPADPLDALARTLLTHIACFAPGEPLPRRLLLQTLNLLDEDVERTLIAEDALTRLIDVGLLETDAGGSLRLHRLLVAFVQAVLGNEAAQAAVEATILRVVDEMNERGNPQPLLAVQAHLRCIIEATPTRADARAASLWNALGEHVRLLGVYPEAKGYLEQALTIRQQVLGPDHLDTARSLNNLGNVLCDQGQYAEARDYYEQALAIRQRVVGLDHPDTARSLNNLGLVLKDQGQYAAAQGYLEQALAIRQRVVGLDHPDIAGSLNNLGNVHWKQGQYTVAQGYHEQALMIRQQMLGPDHPDIAISLNNLGLVLYEQGQYAEAQGYLEQALATWQQVLGTDHSHTADSLTNLGEVLYEQGQYAEAKGCHEQALAICERVLGPDHPATANSLTNLGLVLQVQGQYAEAQGYLEQALAICERVLGEDHPDTATSLNNLGRVLQAQGQYAEARDYYEQALAIRQRILGVEHPDTEQTCQMLLTLQSARAVGEAES